MKNFDFFQDTKIVFGADRINEAGIIAREFGESCLLVTTESNDALSPMYRKVKKINLHQKLKDVNMPEDEIEALARQSMVLPDYRNNPKVATCNEMVQLVKESY